VQQEVMLASKLHQGGRRMGEKGRKARNFFFTLFTSPTSSSTGERAGAGRAGKGESSSSFSSSFSERAWPATVTQFNPRLRRFSLERVEGGRRRRPFNLGWR